MVRIEDVTNESAEETRRAHFQSFPFQYSPLKWYLLIPIGLALLAFIAFYPIRTIKHPVFVVSFLSLFYNTQVILVWIFFIALFLHVVEASIVFIKFPSNTNSKTRLEWTLQTFLLGFSSLGLFMNQLERFKKKA